MEVTFVGYIGNPPQKQVISHIEKKGSRLLPFPSLKLTAKAFENGWLEVVILLGFGLLSGANWLLVLESVICRNY